MELQIRDENVKFCIQNLKDGNELTGTMKSGELIVAGVSTPFVLQRMEHGRIVNMTQEFQTFVTVIIFKQLKSTVFTKRGYVSLQIGNRHGMMWVYIKKDSLKEFFSAICMASL